MPRECHSKVFAGNSDRSSLVTNEFVPALTARFVRLLPQSWHQDISMRFELLGAGVAADISQEFLPLGLEDYVVPNTSMTASSVYSAAYPPSRGRLRLTPSGGFQDAWAARTNNVNQWLQIDLTNLYRITGLATQGRSGEWVRTYKVACSTDGENFHTVQTICPNGEEDMIFTGNSDRSTVVTNTLPRPELCRVVRFLPVTWYGHISARLELYGKGPIASE
ncbi:lactadherin-like [Diadema antillarum]|uniref:lactadherin-like n=1 Tax=Diadema antillarum TaxID=105358 RepID=UPI003A8C3890